MVVVKFIFSCCYDRSSPLVAWIETRLWSLAKLRGRDFPAPSSDEHSGITRRPIDIDAENFVVEQIVIGRLHV